MKDLYYKLRAWLLVKKLERYEYDTVMDNTTSGESSFTEGPGEENQNNME